MVTVSVPAGYERLDHAGAAAAARTLQRLGDRLAHDQNVIAVDLQGRHPGGDRLLRQGLRRSLLFDRHGNRPAIGDDRLNE